MTKTGSTLAILAFLMAGTAAAGDERLIAYSEFADSVPHIALARCPAIVTATSAVCHLAVIDDKLHVFAFTKAGDRRMIAVHSESGGWSTSDFRLSMRN